MDTWKRFKFRIRGWLIDWLNSLMNLLVDKSPKPNPTALERAKAANTHSFVVRLEWDEEDQTYYAYIPELEVMTNADTLPEALYMAGDAGKLVLENIAYDLHTIEYEYDLLSRLLSADYHPAQNLAATAFRQYNYSFDRAGNRRQQIVTVAGTPTTTDYTYNEANQLYDDGTHTLTYDNNGNLTSDGENSYAWDRANRLLSMGGTSYQYDGEGRRVQQTVGANVTQYLLDLQPGLSVVLAETTGANIIRNVHAPRGIHAHKDAAGAWEWMVQDGLGSVRGVVDNSVGVLESRSYDPYGIEFGATSTNQTLYGFTGEPTDDNGLLYLRARYYNPAAGVFTALDPFEGVTTRPMSLNGYSWVEGNTPNMVDPSGMIGLNVGISLATAASLSAGACNVSLSSLLPIVYQDTPQTICGFPVGSGFEDTEDIVRLIAATGYQQNRTVGREAMALTMVAAMNVLDIGGSTLLGLQDSQHIYTYAGCDVVALDACIAAGKVLGSKRQQHLRGEITDAQLQEAVVARDTACGGIDRDTLYTCVSTYMDDALNGYEPYPENSADLARTALRDARKLVNGRCSASGDSGARFEGDLQAKPVVESHPTVS